MSCGCPELVPCFCLVLRSSDMISHAASSGVSPTLRSPVSFSTCVAYRAIHATKRNMRKNYQTSPRMVWKIRKCPSCEENMIYGRTRNYRRNNGRLGVPRLFFSLSLSLLYTHFLTPNSSASTLLPHFPLYSHSMVILFAVRPPPPRFASYPRPR